MSQCFDIIASGPTVPDPSRPQDAIQVLDDFQASQEKGLRSIYHVLQARPGILPPEQTSALTDTSHHIIGNNRLAVEAAVKEAQQQGYRCGSEYAVEMEGSAEEVGSQLSRQGLEMKVTSEINCWISGGEPTVQLVPASRRGRGGRNQQLVLAALDDQLPGSSPWQDMILLSGGTDGEDGPTDAAGAYIDQQVAKSVRQQGLSPRDHLDRNDAYTLFDAVQALVKTGPTHTNVCDLRILLVASR